MASPEQIPTETRESDFDHQLAISVFDYCIDQYHKGSLTYEEAIQAYTDTMLDNLRQDEQLKADTAQSEWLG